MAVINYGHFLSGYMDNMIPELTDDDKKVIRVYRSRIKIPAVIISDVNDHVSTVAARKCIKSIESTSSQIDPVILPATTPADVHQHAQVLGLSWAQWTWPKNPGETTIGPYGLMLKGYSANDIQKVFACSISHMRAWAKCILSRRPMLVLEHDAIFTRKFAYGYGTEKNLLGPDAAGAVAINNPLGATFESRKYNDILAREYSLAMETAKKSGMDFTDDEIHIAKYMNVPLVADSTRPQGLPGNSAYMITPSFCVDLFKKVQEIGIWPNDALMCQQLFPRRLKVLYPHVTGLQGIQSTTTG
jgi:hypothetical protein